MRIVVHSVIKAFYISQESFAFFIKFGYLISDNTISMGYANMYIDLIKGLKEGPLEYKLKMMKGSLHKEVNAEEIEQIETYFFNKKVYDKIKHKTPGQLRWNSKNDKIFLDFYRQWEDVKKVEMTTKGYDFLQKMVEEKILTIQDVIEEGVMFDDIRMVKLETLFQPAILGTEYLKSILILNDIFLNTNELKTEDKFVGAFTNEAADTNNSYFHFVATLFNFNDLTYTELKVLRNSFSSKMSVIKNQLDQWIEICNTSADNTESLRFFKENIIPVLPAIDSFFENEVLLKFYKDNKDPDTDFYMYIGEITKSTLLNYYQSMMPLKDELKQALEDKFKKEGCYNQRIPLIIISQSKNLVLPFKLNEEEDILSSSESASLTISKRKFIEIED